MKLFKLKVYSTPIEHRRPSINVRSPLHPSNCVTKETLSQSANGESFRTKMRNTPTCFRMLTSHYLFANCLHFHEKLRKGQFSCEGCWFVCFETWLGKPMLTLNGNGLKNTANVYSNHLELRIALPCQISAGMWKYVNPWLDFLGIPDQRRAYVKRQAWPRWMPVRRSSVTPTWLVETCHATGW